VLTQDVPVSEDYVTEIQRYEKEIFEEKFAIHVMETNNFYNRGSR
jgi:hypothetical protein